MATYSFINPFGEIIGTYKEEKNLLKLAKRIWKNNKLCDKIRIINNDTLEIHVFESKKWSINGKFKK